MNIPQEPGSSSSDRHASWGTAAEVDYPKGAERLKWVLAKTSCVLSL